MASESVSHGNGIPLFILPGSKFSYDRLAEDVFTYLYDLFRVEKRLIPLPRFAENSYRNPFAVQYISRQSQLDQIVYRGLWYDVFTKDDAALQTHNDVTKLYELVNQNVRNFRAEFIEVYQKCNPDALFHISFAFMVELTLFFIMKKNRNVIKKMARVWVTFFTNNLKDSFEAYGGLSRVLQKTSDTNVMDTLMFTFIRTHCIPYTGKSVHERFLVALDEEVKEKKIAKMMNQELEYLRNVLGPRFPSVPPKSEDDKSELDSSQGLQVYDRLRLAPHENVLKKCVDGTLSPQKAAVARPASLTAKALALQAERRKAKELHKEGSSSSTAKAHLQQHKEKEPASNIVSLSVETTAESTAEATAAFPLQAESRKAKELRKEESSSSMAEAHLQHHKDKEPAANVDESSVETADESTAKAIAALSLQAERRKARKLLKEQSSFSVAKALRQHDKGKESAADVGASSVETTEKPEARPCDRVPPIQHVRYQDDSAGPQSPKKSEITEINYSAQGARPKTRKS